MKKPYLVKQFDGDRTTPPDFEWARDVCLIGQGMLCCRYLVAGVNGLSCEKFGPLRDQLDARADSGKMCAISDNCTGKKSV